MPKRSKPIYLTAAKLKQFRESNTPKVCPILWHEHIDPVVDHDHKTGLIRGVISRQGNSLIGKAENFFNRRCVCAEADLPTALRNMADYLETKMKDRYLHPVGATQLARRFKNTAKKSQEEILVELGVSISDIESCSNSLQRTKIFRNLITTKP